MVTEHGRDVNTLFDLGRAGRDFGDFPPAQKHSPTSRDAARAIRPKRGRLLAILRAAFREAGPRGLTDEEGAIRTGIPGNSYRPRRCELSALGDIRPTAERRETASGARAQVWRWVGGP